jgi:dihydrolipoamide dehydrogenase
VIVAVGRKPRVEGLALESVGIDATPAGIAVDERCRAAEGVWAM